MLIITNIRIFILPSKYLCINSIFYQSIHILRNFIISNFCVPLCGPDICMAHHL